MAADIGADVGRADLPLRELDGGEHRAFRTAGAEIRRARRNIADSSHHRRLMGEHLFRICGHRIGINSGWTRLLQERRDAAQKYFRRVITAARQASLPEDARRNVGAAQDDIDLLLDVVGRTFLDHQHGALADAELLHFLRHQRISDVEHIDRNSRDAVQIGEIEPRQRPQESIGEAAENDDADLADVARDEFVEFLVAGELLRRRQPLLELEPLLREDYRRMGELAVFETRRSLEPMPAAIGAAPVILGDELAGEVAGAHAQIDHHRRVARLGKLEALLDHAHDGRQIGPRIEQPDRGLHRIGVGALLNDARALAVILAEHDERAADDAGRGEIRQCVRGHVGADDRFPGHRAAQRIIDRGAQHRGGRGLIGAGFDVNAEIGQQILGIHHARRAGGTPARPGSRRHSSRPTAAAPW